MMIIMEIWSAVGFLKENFYLLVYPLNLLFSGVFILSRLYFLSSPQWIGGLGEDKFLICSRISSVAVEFWHSNAEGCDALIDFQITTFSVWICITAILVGAVSRPMEIAKTVAWIAHPLLSMNQLHGAPVPHLHPHAPAPPWSEFSRGVFDHTPPAIVPPAIAPVAPPAIAVHAVAVPRNPQSAITRKVNDLVKKRNEILFNLFGSFLTALKTARIGKAGERLCAEFDAKFDEEVASCAKQIKKAQGTVVDLTFDEEL